MPRSLTEIRANAIGTGKFVRNLWLGVFILNLFVLGFAVIAVYSSWRSYQEGARTTTQNLSMSLEREIAGIFDNVDLAFKNLVGDYAEMQRTGQFRLDAWNRGLQQERSHLPILAGLRGTDATGAVIYGLDQNDPKDTSIADRDYFATHRDRADAGLVISQPVLARVSRKWSLVLSRRLNDDHGRFAGVVAATIPLERFSERFMSLKLGEKGSIGMRDKDLRLIVRHPQLAGVGAVGSQRIAADFSAALQRDRNVGSYRAGSTSIDNIRRLHSYRFNSTYAFFINVGVAEAEYLAPWRSECLQIGALACLFLLVTVVVAPRFQIVMENLYLTRFSVDVSSDAIFWITPDARIENANPAACRSLGYSREELLCLRVPDINPQYTDILWPQHFVELRQRGSMTFESTHRRKDGQLVPVEIVANYVVYDGIERDCAFVRDIAERKKMEAQVHQLAFYDPLTRLPNRRLLDDRLGQAMAANRRSGCYAALMFLDLDNFKPLNDRHGHEVGDRLLVEAADRLRSCVREMDTVARFGGDEFVIMISELDVDKAASTAQACLIAEKIRSKLSEPYRLLVKNGSGPETTVEHTCTTSIGVVLFINHEASPDDIVKWADTAMYQAKQAGRDAIRFHG